uniref:Protein SSUH2 homolog isoform X2 n=1 Tax=Saccoglossus kowalevskii TaxID=10224 RepID=A0ABM0N0S2_SACKO|nr:PREDICTED: protein SSUH2 homolog isoform X2 [Saccoglossus kowalevskii]
MSEQQDDSMYQDNLPGTVPETVQPVPTPTPAVQNQDDVPPPPAYSVNGATQPAWTPPGGEVDQASFNWADAPDTEVEDNENAEEPTYQMNQAFQPIPGYEFVTVKESKPIAIQMQSKNSLVETEPENFSSVTDISEEDAKDALMKHVSSHCCYGKKPVKEMTIESVTPSSAYHYSITTFGEQRTAQRLYEPFKGQNFQQAGSVPAPGLWEIEMPPPMMYEPSESTQEVENTSIIDVCHGCTGRGFVKCYRCKGKGKVRCKNCKGKGVKKNEPCKKCAGKGKRRCYRCNGHACITCSVCEGFKQLRFYIVVKNKFVIHNDDHIEGQTALPKKLVYGVAGETLYQSESPMVNPIRMFPVANVNENSMRLVEKHRTQWPTERIIMQKHDLRGVPVSEAGYKWKEKPGKFWVYGNEHKVYFPKYPHNCFCCCYCPCTII